MEELPAVSIYVILVLFLRSTMKTGLKAEAVIQSDQDCASRTQQGKKKKQQHVKKGGLLNKATLTVRVCIVKGLQGRCFQWECGNWLTALRRLY